MRGPRKSASMSASAAPTTSMPANGAGHSSAPAAGIAPTPTSTGGPPKSPADTAFNLLDKDKDGSLSDAEWEKSFLAKKKFADAGIEVRFPLSRDEFSRQFPKAYSTPAK